MLDYNTIFFVECQDRSGFLFHFVNFTQTQVIFYSRLTSKSIPFCFICAVVFNQDHCGESCASSCNPSPSQKFFSLHTPFLIIEHQTDTFGPDKKQQQACKDGGNFEKRKRQVALSDCPDQQSQ